ncbi:MAG: hypothetical protein HC767_04395 [Akkermansiaceae bacterium]|nr:hypothetical protein [Akkermansiaceae bacterium]
MQAMTKRSIAAGAEIEAAWSKTYAAYKEKYPEEAKELDSIMTGVLPEGWEKALPSFTSEDKGLATRAHSQTMLNALAPEIPGFWGGSADLAGSNLTLMKMFGDFQKNQYAERNLRFGVREHGMGAICNGVSPVEGVSGVRWPVPTPVAACSLEGLQLHWVVGIVPCTSS